MISKSFRTKEHLIRPWFEAYDAWDRLVRGITYMSDRPYQHVKNVVQAAYGLRRGYDPDWDPLEVPWSWPNYNHVKKAYELNKIAWKEVILYISTMDRLVDGMTDLDIRLAMADAYEAYALTNDAVQLSLKDLEEDQRTGVVE